MSEIRERAQAWIKNETDSCWLFDCLGEEEGQQCVDAGYVIRDLLVDLERVEQIAAPIINGDVTAELTRLNQRIAELEAENARLKALEDKMGSGWALVEYEKARIQAARECVEIIDKYPAFLFGTDAVGVKLNLSQSIKARFGLDG